MTRDTKQPLVTFHQLYPDAPAPRRADATLSETVPLRAHRYCEPFTAASGFGWYVFPPIDFSLMWEGETVYWKAAASDPWTVLEGAVALPGFAQVFQAHAKEKLGGLGTLPFLGRGLEAAIVQIWTGLLVRTRPGWSILVRPLANHPRDPRYEVLDGIIETDWWLGPIVTPIRIRKTDEPIRFRTSEPLYQVQPVPQEAYAEASLASFDVVRGVEALGDAEWQGLHEALTLRHHGGDDERAGAYKREARRRAKARA
ncbi:MAG: DUF6065 family protein [Thermodesulfobacteriota bacterium]